MLTFAAVWFFSPISNSIKYYHALYSPVKIFLNNNILRFFMWLKKSIAKKNKCNLSVIVKI